jgi:pimeloyl-ACP methyl ester carboxylesterase
MHKKSIYIKEQQYQLHAIDFGGQGECLIAFHGFGLNAMLFEPLAEVLFARYRVVSVDLFFHGQSYWNDNDVQQPITPEVWQSIVQKLLNQLEVQQFSLLGYSMGSRMAVALLEYYAPNIKSVFLCAPDGIIPRMAFQLSTQYRFNRWLFKWLVFRTANILTLINVLTKLHLLSNKVSIFVSQQMYTKRQRRRVYMSWVMFRKLNTSVEKLDIIFTQHPINIHLVLANRDRILPVSYFKPLITLNGVTTHYLDASHAGLINQLTQNKELLKKLFLK